AEQDAAFANPRQIRELVDRRDHEAWQTSEQRLVDGYDRQCALARTKWTGGICAADSELSRLVGGRRELERESRELRTAPRAVLQGDRGRAVPRIALEVHRLCAGGSPIVVALSAHAVRRGCPADPQPDLKRPLAEFLLRIV